MSVPAAAPRRTTRQRSALERVLRASTAFLSAQELHQRLREGGESVGLATVYRNLQAMVLDGEVDVVRSDDGEALYRSCSAQHHHHLLCRSCGHTVEVDGPGVEEWAARVSAAHGFRDVTHTVEIFGLCASCPT